jgi:hypothetical protein
MPLSMSRRSSISIPAFVPRIALSGNFDFSRDLVSIDPALKHVQAAYLTQEF